MKKSSLHALVLLVAAAFVVAPLFAQERTAAPIRQKAPKPKIEKFKGQVMAANAYQMIVRSSVDERIVRTFTFNPEVKGQMLKVIDRGGYQVGDKVEIHHEAGSDVAIKVKGKPSRPL